MKASGADAARRLAAKPNSEFGGVLLYGPDPTLVSSIRQEVVATLIGPAGGAEMRLERLNAADLRRDATVLGDTLKAQGFFPGPRVVLVDGATDKTASFILAALSERHRDDAFLIVTAGALPARSALRKGFETHRNMTAIALYPDPPSRVEVEGRLARAGVVAQAGAVDALVALAAEQDPGAFAQTLEALMLYCHNAAEPATAEDVAAVAPDAGEGDLDALMNSVAEGDIGAIGSQIKRLTACGTAPTMLAITAERHFRALHVAATSPDGAEAGLSRLRPPVFGPRRTRMAAQARRLGQPAAEKALTLLTDTDLALRSSRPVPAMALVERTFIRIAMLAAR